MTDLDKKKLTAPSMRFFLVESRMVSLTILGNVWKLPLHSQNTQILYFLLGMSHIKDGHSKIQDDIQVKINDQAVFFLKLLLCNTNSGIYPINTVALRVFSPLYSSKQPSKHCKTHHVISDRLSFSQKKSAGTEPISFAICL